MINKYDLKKIQEKYLKLESQIVNLRIEQKELTINLKKKIIERTYDLDQNDVNVEYNSTEYPEKIVITLRVPKDYAWDIDEIKDKSSILNFDKYKIIYGQNNNYIKLFYDYTDKWP